MPCGPTSQGPVAARRCQWPLQDLYLRGQLPRATLVHRNHVTMWWVVCCAIWNLFLRPIFSIPNKINMFWTSNPFWCQPIFWKTQIPDSNDGPISMKKHKTPNHSKIIQSVRLKNVWKMWPVSHDRLKKSKAHRITPEMNSSKVTFGEFFGEPVVNLKNSNPKCWITALEVKNYEPANGFFCQKAFFGCLENQPWPGHGKYPLPIHGPSPNPAEVLHHPHCPTNGKAQHPPEPGSLGDLHGHVLTKWYSKYWWEHLRLKHPQKWWLVKSMVSWFDFPVHQPNDVCLQDIKCLWNKACCVDQSSCSFLTHRIVYFAKAHQSPRSQSRLSLSCGSELEGLLPQTDILASILAIQFHPKSWDEQKMQDNRCNP